MLTAALILAIVSAAYHARRRSDRDGWALACMLLVVLSCNTAVGLIPSATMPLWMLKRALMVLQAFALPAGCAVLMMRARPLWSVLGAAGGWLAAVAVLLVQHETFELEWWDRGATLLVLGMVAAWALSRRRQRVVVVCCAALAITDVAGVLIEAAARSGYYEPVTWTRRGVVFSATLLGVTGMLWTYGRRSG